MSEHWSESKYLVLGWQVGENKDREEEIEITMLDLHADPESDCIVNLVAPKWSLTRREAQWHEMEQAGQLIASEFRKADKAA